MALFQDWLIQACCSHYINTYKRDDFGRVRRVEKSTTKVYKAAEFPFKSFCLETPDKICFPVIVTQIKNVMVWKSKRSNTTSVLFTPTQARRETFESLSLSPIYLLRRQHLQCRTASVNTGSRMMDQIHIQPPISSQQVKISQKREDSESTSPARMFLRYIQYKCKWDTFSPVVASPSGSKDKSGLHSRNKISK